MGGDEKRRRVEQPSSSEADDAKRFKKIFSYISRNDLSGLNAYLSSVLNISDDGLRDLFDHSSKTVFDLFSAEQASHLRQYIIGHEFIRGAMATYYHDNVADVNMQIFETAETYQKSPQYYTHAVQANRIDCMAWLLKLDANAFHEHWRAQEGKDFMNEILKAEYNAALEKCDMQPPASAGPASPR